MNNFYAHLPLENSLPVKSQMFQNKKGDSLDVVRSSILAILKETACSPE